MAVFVLVFNESRQKRTKGDPELRKGGGSNCISQAFRVKAKLGKERAISKHLTSRFCRVQKHLKRPTRPFPIFRKKRMNQSLVLINSRNVRYYRFCLGHTEWSEKNTLLNIRNNLTSNFCLLDQYCIFL